MSVAVVSDPEVLHGQARIAGTRVPVSLVLEAVAAGYDEADLRRDYPSLPEGSVSAALRYASELAREEVGPLSPGR